MAHWISSKLKAAETLLQQAKIDQQAAESLGKNDKIQSDDQLGFEKSPQTPEPKPLIKDQFKKKAPENFINRSISENDRGSSDVISRSNSDINRGHEAMVLLNSITKMNAGIGLTDSDWTELLSVPDRKGGSADGIVNWSINGGIHGIKKDGKKAGSSGSRLNFPAANGKNRKGQSNRISSSARKSDLELGINANNDSDERASNAGDATPRTSSSQSPNNEIHLNHKESDVAIGVDNKNSMTKGGRFEVNGTVDGEKPQSRNDCFQPSGMMGVSHERKLDKDMGLNDSETLKRGLSESNGPTVGSKISVKKDTSLLSDGESNSETDTTSSSDSESEREREEKRKRRQQILAEKAAAKAMEEIKDREDSVARLEGEKQTLEKILKERAKQQVQEASELQSTMMETMEAVELEKQRHNNTRMEALARLAKLESANADLARSLANAQKNLEVEVEHIADLRQQILIKEATHEELRRKIWSTHETGGRLLASKGVEFELEMLEAEYSFIIDKLGRMQEKAKTLETSIETTQREVENPTDVEIELKRRLNQMTDHLIQKQAQVESLSSEKAMLQFRIEAVSRLLDENKLMTDSADIPSTSSGDHLQSVVWQLSDSKLKPLLRDRVQSGRQHLGSLVRQLDSLFCAGAVYLRRNSTVRTWSLVYFVCLHLWVFYILMSHSPVSDDSRSGAVISLENINNTGGV